MKGEHPNSLAFVLSGLVGEQLKEVVFAEGVISDVVLQGVKAAIRQQLGTLNLEKGEWIPDACDLWNINAESGRFVLNLPGGEVVFRLDCARIGQFDAAVDAAGRCRLLVELGDDDEFVPVVGKVSLKQGFKTLYCLYWNRGQEHERYIGKPLWSAEVSLAWSIRVHLIKRTSADHLKLGAAYDLDEAKVEGATDTTMQTTSVANPNIMQKNAAPNDISWMQPSECVEEVQNLWKVQGQSIHSNNPQWDLDRLGRTVQHIVNQGNPDARCRAEVHCLVVRNKDKKVAFNSIPASREGVEPGKRVFDKLRDLFREVDPKLEGLTEAIICASFRSPGKLWHPRALQELAGLKESFPTASQDWKRRFGNLHESLCASLAGEPKGLIVLGNTGRIHMIGVTISEWAKPYSSAEESAQQVSNVLFNAAEPCWNMFFAAPGKCGFYFRSQASGAHVALRLLGAEPRLQAAAGA